MTLKSLNFSIIYFFMLIFIVIGISRIILNDTTNWGDDFAQYILHAKNIAQLLPYSNSLYLYDSTQPLYAPPIYPIGYPLILAIIIALKGVDFYIFKVINLLFWAGSVFFIFKLVADRLSLLQIIVITVFLFFTPYLIDYYHWILSDFSFTFFIWAFFYWQQKYFKSAQMKYFMLATLAIIISIFIRPIGLTILIGWLSIDWLYFKKIKWKEVGLIFTTLLLLKAIEKSYITSNGNYTSVYIDLIKNEQWHLFIYFWDKLFYYASDFSSIWLLKSTPSFIENVSRYYLYFVFFYAIYMGIKKKNIVSFCFVFYFLGILAFPAFQGFRYLVPFYGFILYSFFDFTNHFFQIDKKNSSILSICLLLIFIFLSSDFYRNINLNEPRWCTCAKESAELLHFIVSNTPKSAHIISAKPRAILLITGRNGMTATQEKSEIEWKQSFIKYKIDYAIIFGTEPDNYRAMLLNDTMHFKSIFSNEQFKMFKINYPL